MAAYASGHAAKRAQRYFYLGMGAAIAASVVLGFARTVFLRPWFAGFARLHAPVEPWFYVHGAVFLVWIALFVAQTSLMTAGNVRLHRRLGTAGFVIVPLMVLLGTIGSLVAARRPGGFIDVPVPSLQFLAKPLIDMAWFGVLAALALARRNDLQTHKRLMLLANIVLLEAAIVRWPFDLVTSGPDVAFWLKTLFIIPLVIWDFVSRGRVHPATLWGGLFVIAAAPLYNLISGTGAWLAFAQWAVGLLG
jgi:hypothetical protein